MKHLILALWVALLPGLVLANEPSLDAAYEAYDNGDTASAITLSQQVLARDPIAPIALATRELIAIAQFDEGRSGTAFLEELRGLDQDISAAFDVNALERLDTLGMISELEYRLGMDTSRLTDIQIIRIARQSPDTVEDLLLALRNIAVDYGNSDDRRGSLLFATLYAFFADDFLEYGDPFAMEATAMTAIELMRSDAQVRGLQKFTTYSMEDWIAFAQIGSDEESLVADMMAEGEAILNETSRDLSSEINARSEKSAALDAEALEIGEFIARGEIDQAALRMDSYLALTDPDDPWAGNFLGVVMKSFLETGQFSKARPYLGGVLAYPSRYAAALNIPIPVIAATAAQVGGVEDSLLEALLLKGIEIEDILRDPDPTLRVELTFHLAMMKERQNDPQDALHAFERTLRTIEATDYDDPLFFKRALLGAGVALIDLNRLDEANTYLQRFRSQAAETDDVIGMSTALEYLAILALKGGDSDAAVALSTERIALEEGRQEPDTDALTGARIDLAILLFSQSETITPALEALLPKIFGIETQDPKLADARVLLFNTISTQIGNTAEELREDAIFASLQDVLKAELVADLAERAYDAEQIERARSFVSLGFEVAAKGSEDHTSLKLTEGRILQLDGQHGEALMAFRSVTAQRIPQGIRPSQSALAHLPHHMSAAFELAIDPVTGADLRFQNEMFQIAQFASTTVASGALNDAIARSTADESVQRLLRERQTLTRELGVLTGALDRARYDGRSPDDLVKRVNDIRARHETLTQEISVTNPALASLSGFDPIRMENVAQRLREDELLLIYVTSDLTVADGTTGSFLVALTRDDIFVGALPARTDLGAMSRALRCSAALTDPNCGALSGDITRGSFDFNVTPDTTGPVFDTEIAHTAYDILFAPVEELLSRKKRLIIVADQALVSLPFHLTLKAPLAPSAGLSQGEWLIQDHSIEVIPSVSSFVAMRDGAATQGRADRFLGVGDPLIGVQRGGAIPFECGDSDAPLLTASLETGALSRGLGAVRTKAVGALTALPDTRCELRQIAKHFGDDSAVLLHEMASETDIKTLSEAGKLRDYSVISFATHGLVAGEIGVNESGLVLSPPNVPTARDDGLLTTQEIAALDLEAEFVILSACNTASGDSQNSEGLSGMASAFFFAGARSLMVSHWPVYSDAAVDLTTRSFAALQSDPEMARADALRLAMLSILDDPQATARQTHPSYWGPFMIVGDGLGF